MLVWVCLYCVWLLQAAASGGAGVSSDITSSSRTPADLSAFDDASKRMYAAQAKVAKVHPCSVVCKQFVLCVRCEVNL